MRAAVLALAVLAAAAASVPAQVPGRPPVPPARRPTLPGDTTARRAPAAAPRDTTARDTTRRDTVRAGRGAGLPRTPSRQFPAPDSVIQALLERPGFRVTRYMADSVQLRAEEKEIRLAGHGLVEREGAILEADSIRYAEANCGLYAAGSPKLFDRSGVLVGEGMQYDVCNKGGIVGHATTDVEQGGGTWFIRGDLAVDNIEDRVYASGATITSCDLAEPHYHFSSRRVKYVSKTLMVSRPAVLYIADVPVAWLPFVVQDARRGRRSGILTPQFGVNDIVRFSTDYQRHVANIGYYFAISDYMDAQVALDWFPARFTSLNGRFRYRWLDRFLAGGINWMEFREAGGASSRRISWSHQQQFSLRSQLTANIDYATSSRVISNNAVDPVLSVGTIDSRLNYSRRFDWGVLSLGGSRTQALDKPEVSTTFPTVSFAPSPIALASWLTWSPSFSLTNSLRSNTGTPVAVPTGPATRDSLLLDSRNTQINIASPLRIGRWELSNAFSISDQWSSARSRETSWVHTGPTDSVLVVRTWGESFQTGVDWSVGVGLPAVFQGTWNVQPAVQMVNTGSGPYFLRNQFTDGAYVSQGKRFQFQVGVAPTFFGLFPGAGPVTRIRHAVAPGLTWAYSPAADVPEAYARAANRGQLPATLRQPARHTLSIGLSQNFEAKLRPPARPAGDTATAPADAPPPEGRKLKLLSIQSDAIGYDFEQARLPGRSGWTTDQWGNTLSSDLIRGFSLRIAHDLWDGPVGYDSARFAPYLTSVTTGFSIGAGTVSALRRLLGLGGAEPARQQRPAAADSLPERSPTEAGRDFATAYQRGPLATSFTSVDRLGRMAGGSLQASLNFSLQRQRPAPNAAARPGATSTTNSMLSGTVTFSPTRHWSVAWQTSYNFTTGQFAEQVLRLDRTLHDWRAMFTFVRSPNGNFLFNFSIVLTDEPDLKFEYDQRNIR